MKIRLVGAFRELPHGDKDGLSIREYIRSEPDEFEVQIIAYLRSGVSWIACSGIARDVLDPSSHFMECPIVLTDGEWAWYADLPYYVETYHIRLPDEFLEHMQNKAWKILPIDEAQLNGLELYAD